MNALATVLLALTVAGCGAPPNDPVPDAAQHQPLDGGPGGTPFACARGQMFCDGSIFWACSYSGKDASFVGDCHAVSAAATCASSCPAGTVASKVSTTSEIYCCAP